jgi:hypothetical protein
MTLFREGVPEPVRQLSDEVDVGDLIYHLYLREKPAAAEIDMAAGRTLSAKEVRECVR